MIYAGVRVHLLESPSEVAHLLLAMHKSIADLPLRYSDESSGKGSDYSSLKLMSVIWGSRSTGDSDGMVFCADSGRPTKGISIKDSEEAARAVTFKELWKQQLQQISRCPTAVAVTIVARYPTPVSLLKAYDECVTEKERENLVADMFVRREAGQTASERRIGPKLSKTIYKFMCAEDGEELIE